ncbi:hypothetical protein BG003_004271 [Podila horticola]|nr:hypothetical protein BG003_004271 [Podila horticola]
MLKSFVLSLTSSPEQLELLCTNPGIVSLQWLDFKSNEVTEPLLNMLLPLATSLKELTLSYHGSSSARVPFALLNILTRLERLRIGASSSVPSGQGPSSPPSLIAFQASAPAGSVQHMSLKQLTVMSNISNPATSSLMVQILSHSPKISHLDIMLSECLESHPMDGIHAQVVGWNAAYRDWIQSLDAPPYALPLDSTVSALEDMPNDAHRGLERLEILQRTSSYNFHTWIRPQYERGCQDLVGVSAKFHCDGPRLLVPLLEQWKHMVQQVDIDFGPYLGSHAAFSILSQVLGSLTALKHLRFVAEGGFAKEDSFAIFRDKLGRQDDQGDDDESETAVTTIENVSPAWACQGLESLVIKGLWGTMSKDRLDKGQSAITLQAASERHHWVAYGATKFGKQFRAIVSDRIGTLPALRRLTLNKMAFDYFERCE